MVLIDYPDEFLDSKINKEYLSQIISKLEDSSIQIDSCDLIGDSKTITMLQVYEASKKLSSKRNKEAKQLGDELSNMVKECFADYNKLYDSTTIKKTMGSETSKAKKNLFEKLDKESGGIFTLFKNKKRLNDLKRCFKRKEYGEAVEIAKEINTEESANLLIKESKKISDLKIKEFLISSGKEILNNLK
jgi:DNA-binding IscR family transcriptional regulator